MVSLRNLNKKSPFFLSIGNNLLVAVLTVLFFHIFRTRRPGIGRLGDGRGSADLDAGLARLARLAADAGVRSLDVDEPAESRQLLDDDVTAAAVAGAGRRVADVADRADPVSGVPATDERLVLELVRFDVDLEIGVTDPVFGVSEVKKDLVFRGAFENGSGSASGLLLGLHRLLRFLLVIGLRIGALRDRWQRSFHRFVSGLAPVSIPMLPLHVIRNFFVDVFRSRCGSGLSLLVSRLCLVEAAPADRNAVTGSGGKAPDESGVTCRKRSGEGRGQASLQVPERCDAFVPVLSVGLKF